MLCDFNICYVCCDGWQKAKLGNDQTDKVEQQTEYAEKERPQDLFHSRQPVICSELKCFAQEDAVLHPVLQKETLQGQAFKCQN